MARSAGDGHPSRLVQAPVGHRDWFGRAPERHVTPRKNSLGVSSRGLRLRRDGVELAVQDFGGRGPATLLVHGLAGRGLEWSMTAWWLTDRSHVVAVDLRGHGESERTPKDVAPDALVADLIHVVEVLGLAPVVLVGQSIGGLIALQLAARRPDLVRGLVMVDAAPTDGDVQAARAEAERVRTALGEWPVPFADLQHAVEFFTARHNSQEVGFQWAVAMEERPDGLWPPFDTEVVTQLLEEVLGRPGWPGWESVRCPTLLVRATRGSVSAATAARMRDGRPEIELVEVDAGHDLHLQAPVAWREALSAFLDRLDRPSPT